MYLTSLIVKLDLELPAYPGPTRAAFVPFDGDFCVHNPFD